MFYKKLVGLTVLSITVLSILVLGASPEYNCGFKDGFKSGYCYGEYGCIAPIAPVPPVPGIGKDNYQGGYDRGFVAGRQAKQNK